MRPHCLIFSSRNFLLELGSTYLAEKKVWITRSVWIEKKFSLRPIQAKFEVILLSLSSKAAVEFISVRCRDETPQVHVGRKVDRKTRYVTT